MKSTPKEFLMLLRPLCFRNRTQAAPGAYFPGSNGRGPQSGFASPGALTPTVDRDKAWLSPTIFGHPRCPIPWLPREVFRADSYDRLGDRHSVLLSEIAAR